MCGCVVCVSVCAFVSDWVRAKKKRRTRAPIPANRALLFVDSIKSTVKPDIDEKKEPGPPDMREKKEQGPPIMFFLLFSSPFLSFPFSSYGL
jgi:hypothetical protein